VKISLIVTTYNRADALELVLKSAARQSRPPDELVVADDGSGPDTARIVERYVGMLPFRLLHTWQEDHGYRVARIRNLGIARATGDYIVLLDGDMVMHRHFLRDHERAAAPSTFTQGDRIRVLEPRTRQMLRDRDIGVRPFGKGLEKRRYAFRSALFNRLKGTVVWPGSGNQGLWRGDLLRVNGFNERFVGWGGEDDELALRLTNVGVRRRSLRFLALAYHLHHEPRSRDRRDLNRRLLAEAEAARAIWCNAGLDAHLEAAQA
jgi:glycosyltransferase involved in cell wall biosynthesis